MTTITATVKGAGGGQDDTGHVILRFPDRILMFSRKGNERRRVTLWLANKHGAERRDMELTQ